MRARLGWVVLAATVVCAAAETWFLGARGRLASESAYLDGWPLISSAAVAGALMAALILSRYPRHPIGWLLSLGYFGTAVGLCAEAFGTWVLGVDPSWTEVAHTGIWLGALFGTPYGVALVTAQFVLVPDGRLPSPRWRAVLVVAAVGLTLHVAALVGLGPAGLSAGERAVVPPWIVRVDTASNVVLLGALVAGAVALTRRTRAAHGVRRAQLRWIAASAVALAVGLVVALVGLTVVQLVGGTFQAVGSVPPLVVTPLFLGYAAVPVCTGIAVLRWGLYDVDVVINRALVVATATLLVTVLYVAAVVVIGGLLGSPVGGFTQSLAATAIAAVAFQPLRRRVLGLADRLAYGPRAAPYETLADLSSRATTSPTPQGLLDAVAGAVGAAIAARGSTAVLTVPGAAPLTAEWCAPGSAAREHGDGAQTRIDVVHDGEALGWVGVRMPPGRPLRSADHALLHDLVAQAAVGFRNARLEAELAGHLATLARRTAQLERSRRRIIHAQDHERMRLEDALRRDVLPHLTGLPGELEAAADAVRHGGVPVVEPFVVRTSRALEALRELSHGLLGATGRAPGAHPPATPRS